MRATAFLAACEGASIRAGLEAYTNTIIITDTVKRKTSTNFCHPCQVVVLTTYLMVRPVSI